MSRPPLENVIDPVHRDTVRRVSAYSRIGKRLLDLTVGTGLMIVLSPLLLAAALAARLSLGKPVLYRQERVGRQGRTFWLYKLRTMTPDRRNRDVPFPGPDRRRTHKSRSDPRVPRAGAVLRAFHLDELPQLWNVIKGDMSLVGPRPELPQIVERYAEWQHRRHVVKPGLTGLWQVSDLNGHPMHECTEVDLEYLSTMGLGTDLSILLRTPVAVLRRHGY